MPRIANVTTTSSPQTHRSPPSCVAGPYQKFYQRLLFGFVAILLLHTMEMRPVSRNKRNTSIARWINPCDLPDHLLDPTTDFKGLSNVDEGELANELASKTGIVLKHGTRALLNYTIESFPDSFFVEGTASHRLTWLPKVDRSHTRYLSLKAGVSLWYNIMQYYAVGIEQIVTDEVLYGGKFLALSKDLENQIMQILCRLGIAHIVLGIKPSPDITRDVMRQEYRSGSHSQRMIRNYLILRDLASALDAMYETFGNISGRTLLVSTTPNNTQFYYESQSYAVEK